MFYIFIYLNYFLIQSRSYHPPANPNPTNWASKYPETNVSKSMK